MKTTLCIVDMQDTFNGTKKALSGTLHQIALAKRRKSDIVVLELTRCGNTVDEIYKALLAHDTNKVTFVGKINADGSKEFVHAAEEKGFWLKRIRVCGVNRCACVRRTLEGLQRILPESRIEVALDAVSCECISHCEWYDEKFEDMGLILK